MLRPNCARLGVGGHVTRIVVSDAGDKARPRLAIGGAIVWSGGALTVVVTLIAWLALRGVVWLFTPQEKLVQYYEALHFEQKCYVATAITGALGLYLSIAGFVG